MMICFTYEVRLFNQIWFFKVHQGWSDKVLTLFSILYLLYTLFLSTLFLHHTKSFINTIFQFLICKFDFVNLRYVIQCRRKIVFIFVFLPIWHSVSFHFPQVVLIFLFYISICVHWFMVLLFLVFLHHEMLCFMYFYILISFYQLKLFMQYCFSFNMFYQRAIIE